MKKLIAGILSAALALSLTACGGGANSSASAPGASSASTQGGPSSKPTYVLKLSHDMSEDTPQQKGAEKFKQEVEEKTNGDVQVDIYADSQLGSDTEVAEMLQSNIVQCALIPTAKLSGIYAPMQLLDLPYLCSDRNVLYQVLDDSQFKDAFFGGMSSIGLKGLSVWESGYKQFTANSRLAVPTDFQGLKFRTMESPLILAQFQALGANPKPIDFGETYNALQNHTVDGEENPLVSIVNMKFYEVQSHITLSNHAYLGYAFLFSDQCWQSLPADDQSIIQTAADNAAVYERQLTAEAEQGYIKTIQDAGVDVYQPTAEEAAAMSEAVKPVYAQFRDTIGGDLIDLTQQLIAKYGASGTSSAS